MKRWLRWFVAPCAAVWAWSSGCQSATFVHQAPPGGSHDVFVAPAELETLQASGASVLDARSTFAYRAGHIEGAVHTPWDDFVAGSATGKLIEVDRIVSRLEKAGVRSDAPVIVYGDWHKGWGEEGRIYWMLSYLGHAKVRILYGGVGLWRQTDRAMVFASPEPSRGDLTVALVPTARAMLGDVEAELKGDALLIDVRTRDEYEGSTPHGAERGGRIPGAVHLHWEHLFDAQGDLRPRAELEHLFVQLGMSEDRTAISYCTGGVRSGFMFAVMRWLGFVHVRNYDGSWWEWSGESRLPVETR